MLPFFSNAPPEASAMKEFERAVELNSTLPTAQSHLAQALRNMGRVDEAQVHFRKELEINPHDFDSLLYTGVYLYKQEQNYKEALKRFEHALRIRVSRSRNSTIENRQSEISSALVVNSDNRTAYSTLIVRRRLIADAISWIRGLARLPDLK